VATPPRSHRSLDPIGIFIEFASRRREPQTPRILSTVAQISQPKRTRAVKKFVTEIPNGGFK
jgi:hypothetical protein